MTESHEPVSRGRLKLILLALLFLGPFAGAWIWFKATGTAAGPAGAPRGDLLEPALPLTRVAMPRLDAGYTEPDFLTGKWSLLYIDSADCPTECRDNLTNLRQLRLSFGKDMERIQQVFIGFGDGQDLEYLAAEHPDLLSVRADANGQFLRDFPSFDGVAVTENDRVYLVDPLGNLVLSYVSGTELTDIKKDLKRLLKVSRIG